MPKVVCSHCGEELMGSVNRCWRCGRTFVAEHNPENLPPIRRRPIPLDLVNKSLQEMDELARAAAQPSASAAAEPALAYSAATLSSQAVEEPVLASVAGSDDRAIESRTPLPESELSGRPETALKPPARMTPSHLTATSPTTPYYSPPPTPWYPANAGATGGAIAAVVLGVMSLAAIKFITPGALLISILGVGMGVWGLHSDRRAVAVFGLLLCCVAMAVSGFLTAVQLFTLINGYSPFEADLPPVDPASF
jgi:hypothetical protein